MSAGEPSLVSVILPCHNADAFLESALRSILDQTYRDLEVLAIDDGSTDRTRVVLDRMAAIDPRVRVLINERNLGLIPTLNRGVQEARGAYIARMDADDVALPHRIETQIAHLESHPEMDVVGSSAAYIDAEDRQAGSQPARCLRPGALRFMVAFANPLIHPTLVARSHVMKAHPYGSSPEAQHTEDYELFSRMVGEGVGLGNVPDVLLKRRMHGGSVSRRHEAIQVENFVACSRAHLARRWGGPPEAGAHGVLVNRMNATTTPSDLREGLRLLERLEREFQDEEPLARAEIVTVARQQRADILLQAGLKGSMKLRLAALGYGIRYLPGLLTPGSLRYIAAKVDARPGAR